MIKELTQICDRLSAYDNSKKICRIYKKKDAEEYIWENKFQIKIAKN